jgi:transposase InsO family protein
MARKVTSMDARMVSAVTSAVRDLDSGVKVNVTRLSAGLGITPKTFYKWADRYRVEGLAGLEERSRKPHRSPHQISPTIEDTIVELRKRLADRGEDHGPDAIQWHLAQDKTARPPSEATIWRALVRRGFITPEPRKRPKSSWRRFEAAAPNECWQIDATHWVLASGTVVEIINIIDDHSRVLAASHAVRSATSNAAWNAFVSGVGRLGLPRGCLSDNGVIFSGKLRGFEVYFEAQLRAAGVHPITARPYHPQTCGKVERFHQTLKKWLRARRRQLRTIAQLQAALDEFRDYYNHHRPHRGIHRQIPWERFTVTAAAPAPTATLPSPPQTLHATTDDRGVVTAGRWRIHIGVDHAAQPVTVLLHRTHADLFIHDRLVRSLELDADRRYQPSGLPRGRRHA